MKLNSEMARRLFTLAAASLMVGCQSSTPVAQSTSKPEAPSAAPASFPPAAAAANAAAMPVSFPLRIKAGLETDFKDSSQNVWLAERGFVGGDSIDRGVDLEIANTKDPGMYRTEHYGMSAFSQPVPNGKYIVKLHFCETFDGIEGPGQRVFSFKVGDREFKDFDVWVKAGGPRKVYIETVNVDVTNGKLEIQFITNIENPQINAIEIWPAS